MAAFQQEIWQELERAATENARRAVLHAIGYEEMTYQREQRRPPSPPSPRFDEQVHHWFSSIVVPFITWVIKTCFVLFFLLLLSIGIYSLLWGTIMRGLDVKSRHVYFDYSPGGGASNIVMPTALVDLRSMKNTPWSHNCGGYSSDQSPSSPSSPSGEYSCLSDDVETISNSVGDENNDTVRENTILAPGQRYFFELVLTLPESDINKQLGVFMVKVELLSAGGSLLAASKQHSMLPYESSIVTLFRKTMLILPLVFGLISETRTITLLTFDHYTGRSGEKPISLVKITLGVPDPASFPTTLQTIQIHSAELRYGKEMNVIQAFLRRWQYSCAIILISALFFGFVSMSRRVQRRRWEEPYADFFDLVDDETADSLYTSSHDRWMGADIEILEESENDSNEWEPIVSNENKAKTTPVENVSVPSNLVSEDESSSFRQRQSYEQKKCAKLSSGELGTNSTLMNQEPHIATTPNDNEQRNHEMVDKTSSSQKKEEEHLADMVMKGLSKWDIFSGDSSRN